MGFLDNSGDIILDAVLTDAGRQRLARGDGSFRISQFAFGDDEINYGLFNKNTGSAYQDAEILTTPILEAFTNNVASMNSKLMTITRNNLTHLPVIKLSEDASLNSSRVSNSDTLALKNAVSGTFVISCDTATFDYIKSSETLLFDDLIYGNSLKTGTSIVLFDQGFDSEEPGSAAESIDADLKETEYIVEMDNRLGILVDRVNFVEAAKSFVDDDYVASYYFSLATDPDYIRNLKPLNTTDPRLDEETISISGKRGTRLGFTIKTSLDLKTSEYYFDQFGQSDVTLSSGKMRIIKSNIVVTGGTTGYSVTVPVSFVKYIAP
jgi:hypothetical protein